MWPRASPFTSLSLDSHARCRAPRAVLLNHRKCRAGYPARWRCSGNAFPTLPRHDPFSRGLWERRKLWNLQLAHLTVISMQSSCSTGSLNCSLVKWVPASKLSRQPALGSWLRGAAGSRTGVRGSGRERGLRCRRGVGNAGGWGGGTGWEGLGFGRIRPAKGGSGPGCPVEAWEAWPPSGAAPGASPWPRSPCWRL